MILESILPHLNHIPKFKKLALKMYAMVPLLVLARAKSKMIRGSYYGLTGRKKEQYQEFLDGASIWGQAVEKSTATKLVLENAITPPESGHLIFLNHVNELDFAFDCLVIRRPYLANQAIKETYFAYWWMMAMGSQVYDVRRARTIAATIKNVLDGLKLCSYVVYPEGKNTYGESIQPLRKGMLKLAFENNIPIYLVLKSGLAAFQERPSNNTLIYRACGVFQPGDHDSWEALRDAVHEVMTKEKATLDAARRGSR